MVARDHRADAGTADAPHLAGNAAATVVLVTAVCWYLGPGVGLCCSCWRRRRNAVTAASTAAITSPSVHPPATFGAIGILAAWRIVAAARERGGRKSWVVIAASLALLAAARHRAACRPPRPSLCFILAGGWADSRAHHPMGPAAPGPMAARRRCRRSRGRRVAPGVLNRGGTEPTLEDLRYASAHATALGYAPLTEEDHVTSGSARPGPSRPHASDAAIERIAAG